MAQRESPILAQLCTKLILDQYGGLPAVVFRVLARYGRQTLPSLVRYSGWTSIRVKHGLATLLQQHLIFHSAGAAQEHDIYEVDWQGAYSLVRFGKMAYMAENRFGKKAGAVVSNIASLGHARVGDLVQAYFPPGGRLTKSAKTNGHTNGFTNGVHREDMANGDSTTPDVALSEDEDKPRSTAELHAILAAMLDHGWVVPVDETSYLSPGDRHSEAEAWVVAERLNGEWPTSLKGTADLKRMTIERKRDVRDQSLTCPHDKIKHDNSKKRRAEDDGLQPSKRLKNETNGATVVNTAMQFSSLKPEFPENVTLDDDLILRVNQEKLTVALRSEQLVRLAEKRLSRTTSQVYEVLLHCLEKAEPRCYEYWPDLLAANAQQGIEYDHHVEPEYLVTCIEIRKWLDPSIDLLDGLDPTIAVTLLEEQPSVDDKGNITPPIDPLSLSQQDRLRLINKHVSCLANDGVVPFVTWQSSRGGGQYRVEYDVLSRVMIQMEIENTVMARKGKMGLRLIRALRNKGKLDEKQLVSVMLTQPQSLRPIMTSMQLSGFVETQEVPRVDSRVTKQSFHLAWFDAQRCRDRLLHDTYKGMVRVLQRIDYEKEKVAPVIEKAERTDVVGNEDRYLTEQERQALREFGRVEEKLLHQLSRMDDLVAVLRDFYGPLPSAFPVGFRSSAAKEIDAKDDGE